MSNNQTTNSGYVHGLNHGLINSYAVTRTCSSTPHNIRGVCASPAPCPKQRENLPLAREVHPRHGHCGGVDVNTHRNAGKGSLTTSAPKAAQSAISIRQRGETYKKFNKGSADSKYLHM